MYDRMDVVIGVFLGGFVLSIVLAITASIWHEDNLHATCTKAAIAAHYQANDARAVCKF